MDYFDSVFICIAIFCSVLVLCTLCCHSSKDNDSAPIHNTEVVVTSSRHSPLRRAVSNVSRESQRLRGTEVERSIGFTDDVVSGPSAPQIQPSPPYPVENLMPIPVTRLRPDPPSTPRDINPPSYEEVMSNESYYHPQKTT
ncbi:integral component of membrane [Sergentomyia squamirostris]